MNDAADPYGAIQFGQPAAPTLDSDRITNALIRGMMNASNDAGPRIQLDDFGNPIPNLVTQESVMGRMAHPGCAEPMRSGPPMLMRKTMSRMKCP